MRSTLQNIPWAHMDNGRITLKVTVCPSASRNGIKGVYGDTLKISLTAPPEHGKANSSLITLLAETLPVRKSDIELISGSSNRRKSLSIRGLTIEQLTESLGLS